MHIIPKVFLIISLLGLTFSDLEKKEQNHYFGGGEELTFKVRYLFFNAAEAKMTISNTIYQIQNRPTYKIDVTGRTLNIFKIFYVNDNWGTYVDTAKMIPYMSYRHLKEGNYRKHEQINFDHQNKTAVVNIFDRDNRKITETTSHDISTGIQDIVSGFYYLRTMDLSNMRKGQEVNIRGFFDKK